MLNKSINMVFISIHMMEFLLVQKATIGSVHKKWHELRNDSKIRALFIQFDFFMK
jgi:hypothetical protein